jgi:hypothetical protein
MIAVEMTIREMISLATNPGCSGDLYERLVNAIERAAGEGKMNVTLRSMRADAMIPCIKALRLATGWGLKESKEFCDTVRGKSDGYGNGGFWGGTANTVTLKTDAARELAKQWKELGCDVITDTFNC